MYMYADGTVQFGDGASYSFGEEMGYGSIEEVEQLALELIQKDTDRLFTISGTLNTDYSNLDYSITYNGSICVVQKTDYYWWYGMDEAWFEGESDDPLSRFCDYYGIMTRSKAYRSLKKAYEESECAIYSNDERTEFYSDVPYVERGIIFKDGKPCSLWETLGKAQSGKADSIAQCVFCDKWFEKSEIMKKQSPDGSVSCVCKKCCKDYDLDDWQTVTDD